MTEIMIRLVNTVNGNEAHHHSEQGEYWLEWYKNGIFQGRILVGEKEAK